MLLFQWATHTIANQPHSSDHSYMFCMTPNREETIGIWGTEEDSDALFDDPPFIKLQMPTSSVTTALLKILWM